MINDERIKQTGIKKIPILNISLKPPMRLSNASIFENSDNEMSKVSAMDKSENNKIIHEYENWINMLLNIMNNSDNSGFVDVIKTGIEKIRTICEDDVDAKTILIKELMNSEENKKISQIKSNEIEDLRKKLNTDVGKLILSKMDLINNINSLSEDTETMSELLRKKLLVNKKPEKSPVSKTTIDLAIDASRKELIHLKDYKKSNQKTTTPQKTLSEVDVLRKELLNLRSENKELKEIVTSGLGGGKVYKIFEIMNKKSNPQYSDKFSFNDMFNCTSTNYNDMDLLNPKFYNINK